MELVTHVYDITKSFPDDERFGLVSQRGDAPFRFPATSPKASREIQEESSSSS